MSLYLWPVEVEQIALLATGTAYGHQQKKIKISKEPWSIEVDLDCSVHKSGFKCSQTFKIGNVLFIHKNCMIKINIAALKKKI